MISLIASVRVMYDLDGVPSREDALAGFSNYSRNVGAGNPLTSPRAAIDLAAAGVNIASMVVRAMKTFSS